MNWFDFAAYIITAIFVSVLVYFIIALLIKNRRLTATATQATIDRMAAMDMLYKLMDEQDGSEVEKTDGFLKFISDSRDWAFDYIEKVQDAITAYDDALSKNDAVAMNEAYKNLLSMLPQDDVVS
jgi:hypothetical protein